jgi:ribosomal protein S18 acetylase RimI-like enzyme
MQSGEHILAEAARAGSRLIRLDTADTMLTAQRLYHRPGFREAPPYCGAAPEIMAQTRFMERAMTA